MHNPNAFRGIMREELQKSIAGILGDRNNEIRISSGSKNTLKTYTSILLSGPFRIFEEVKIVQSVNDPSAF
jgi:hypothetical protein